MGEINWNIMERENQNKLNALVKNNLHHFHKTNKNYNLFINFILFVERKGAYPSGV